MTKEKNLRFVAYANEQNNNPNIKSAIERHKILSMEANSLQKDKFEIEDKLTEIYHSICESSPIEPIFDETIPERERLKKAGELWLKNDPKIAAISEIMEKSGKKGEIDALEAERKKATFAYFEALLKLDSAIAESRESLFSEDYKKKMREYADQGVLLYFLETPDLPILEETITVDDILDFFSIDGYSPLYTLFYPILNEENPSPSLRRKIEDIDISIALLAGHHYRSAARNLFALLESEHSNCALAMKDYFKIEDKRLKGDERAKNIESLLKGIDYQAYFRSVWEIINPIYRDILKSKVDTFIDRNSIIHGAYEKTLLDVSEKDVIRLFLLYLNMRMISDHVQLYCDMLIECLREIEIASIRMKRNSKKASNTK